jgi:hypothetical protein
LTASVLDHLLVIFGIGGFFDTTLGFVLLTRKWDISRARGSAGEAG